MADERNKPGALARLVEELAPGGLLVRTRRLRGGLGARMQVLEIDRADGSRLKVSLRRFVRDHPTSTHDHVAHEYRILQLVEEAGIAAPRPLLLDAEGRLFDVPAIVLTYLPGRPLYASRDLTSWTDQLAQALLTIHTLTNGDVDLSWLSLYDREGMRNEIGRREEEARERGPLAREVHAVLKAEIDQIRWIEPVFVHDDFWLGNTVWRYGRLVGVIDWTSGELGDPRADVSQCRADLALSLGIDAADAFLEAYQARAAQPLPDVWYFDLFRGLRALLYYEQWLEGYHDAGLTHLTSALARDRVEAFLRTALDRARRGGATA